MPATQLLDTRTVDLSELFTNGKIYRVPPYQRDYAWSDEQWEDLWNDIVEAQLSGEPHYMGALVVQRQADTALVIDGQQRLATLSVLILAVLDKLRNLYEQAPTEEARRANEERFELLRQRYIGVKDPVSLRSSPRLVLNERNHGICLTRLVELSEPPNVRRLPETNRRLWRAFRYFAEKLGTHLGPTPTGEQLAGFVDKVIARRLAFILITVEDELSAYTVFETLNARGVGLTATDLLKNYLFSKVSRSSDDLLHVETLWREITERVGVDAVPPFLRNFLNAQQELVSKERVFKALRARVTAPGQVFELLGDLERQAEWYKALDDPQDELWQDLPDCRIHVRVLSLFKVTQYRSLMLAAHRAFAHEPRTLERLLRLCVVVSFRFNVIGQRNPNELEKAYNRAAMGVHGGTLRTPSEVHAALRGAYVPDDEFRDAFALRRFRVTAHKKLVRYILGELERHHSGRAVDFEDGGATIEHILPENPGDGWDAFDDATRDRFTARLGNLTLLERGLQKQAGNGSFDQKLAAFATSHYELTRRIDVEEWAPEAINRRQRDMAAWATSVWRFGPE